MKKNGNLFATRAMEGLDDVLKDRIPHAEHVEEIERQELSSHLEARGGKPDSQFYFLGYRKLRSEGYVQGLKEAFQVLYEHITGEHAWMRIPVEEEQEGKSEEGDSNPKK